ncbi:kinase-like protein [Backusella circina FSU 941]|nr:kinase-like protein [Backusella circina FSU 941]
MSISKSTNRDVFSEKQLSVSSMTHSGPAAKPGQTKWVLVSLIEKICNLYGESPEESHKIFLEVCKPLTSLGFLGGEVIDQVAGVRSTYYNVFEKLLYTSVELVRKKNNIDSNGQPKLLTFIEKQHILTEQFQSCTFLNDDIKATTRSSTDFLRDAINVQNSRYYHDFNELNMLGRGGFASAWRARNKLDGREYAIKKIRLYDDSDKTEKCPYDRIFREIKNLARMEHPNIVRYYSSWLEYACYDDQEEDDSDDDEVEEDSYFITSLESDSDDDKHPALNVLEKNKSFSLQGVPFISFEDATPTRSFPRNVMKNTKKRKTSKDGLVLFIQMQLCPSTLQEYIRFRNQQLKTQSYFDNRRNIEIFRQLLEGAAYMHKQRLIHRDLKPGNIFLSRATGDRSKQIGPRRESELLYNSTLSPHEIYEFMTEGKWVPKIGDFGLAADINLDDDDDAEIQNILPSVKPETTARCKMANRTCGVGTRTYAAPEQLATPPQPYDEKADIYSLGIIMFELYFPCTTGMERASAIDNLKRGIFPPHFEEMFPLVVNLVSLMMKSDPKQRPTASELLHHELFTRINPEEDHINISAFNAFNNKPTSKMNDYRKIVNQKDRMLMNGRYAKMKKEKENLERQMRELEKKLSGLDICFDPAKHTHHK